MDAEKKLDTIEDEMKLLKGELKQSLTSVRDYLLNMELPSSEFSTILAALGSDGEGSQKVTIEGNVANSGGQPSEELTDNVEEVTEEVVPEPDDELSLEPNDILSPEALQESQGNPSDAPTYDGDIPESDEPVSLLDPEETVEPAEPIESDYGDADNELDDLGETDDNDDFYKPAKRQPKPSLEENPLMEYENVNNESQAATPKVNLLANLINWVAKAKKEIGDEQLPTFLEVYGVSGHLSPELKEAILQLCDITTEQPEAASRADVWSQSMLSLHGILTGGDAPLYPFKSTALNAEDEEKANEDEIIEVDKPNEQPIKLKLVLPNGNGGSREFCVDLAPSMEGD